ncbi:MAG: CDP-diacylglycerol--serine O-phosphatidyltransferase @ Archaetidylserine synthase, partial [uncultured Sphingomonadaceae bacterium]
ERAAHGAPAARHPNARARAQRGHRAGAVRRTDGRALRHRRAMGAGADRHRAGGRTRRDGRADRADAERAEPVRGRTRLLVGRDRLWRVAGNRHLSLVPVGRAAPGLVLRPRLCGVRGAATGALQRADRRGGPTAQARRIPDWGPRAGRGGAADAAGLYLAMERRTRRPWSAPRGAALAVADRGVDGADRLSDDLQRGDLRLGLAAPPPEPAHVRLIIRGADRCRSAGRTLDHPDVVRGALRPADSVRDAVLRPRQAAADWAGAAGARDANCGTRL